MMCNKSFFDKIEILLKKNKISILFFLHLIMFVIIGTSNTYANTMQLNPSLSSITIDLASDGNGVDPTLQIFFLVTLISFLPTILLMMTSFTRIIITMSMIRSALGTQQQPPNQVLIGIALFLTFFIMGPTFQEINENAIQPYSEGVITQEIFMEEAMIPLREFMYKQTAEKDVALFASFEGETYDSVEDIPSRVLIPAFILGEITKGFQIGFIIYIPFIVIDMIVASILMAMGMMMLPPAMISMPFKLLFFVLADGWVLIFENLIKTFR